MSKYRNIGQPTRTCKFVIVMINTGTTILRHPIWSVITLVINFTTLHIIKQMDRAYA